MEDRVLYIITTSYAKQDNTYKIGIHTGSKNKLIKRYITSLFNLEILYFEHVDNADIIESGVLYYLDHYRVINANCNQSEWIKIDFLKIIDAIEYIIQFCKEYGRTKRFIKKRKPYNKKLEIKNLLKCDDTKFDIDTLIIQQNNNDLTAEEKLVLKKYYFRKIFKIPHDLSKKKMEEMLNKYLGKEVYMKRFKYIFQGKKPTNLSEHESKKERACIKIIRDILSILLNCDVDDIPEGGFEDVDIQKPLFIKRLTKLVNESIYYRNEVENRLLFGKKKVKMGKFNPEDQYSVQAYVKNIGSLLKSYNVILSSGQRYITAVERRDRKIETLKEMIYTLKVDNDIFNAINRDPI